MAKNTDTINSIAHRILIEPWITEAATMLAQANKYVFRVAKDADKRRIKRSVEDIYRVSVVSVKTINIPGKIRTRGRISGKRSGFKKAIVTVKEGESINVFDK